MNSWSLLIWPIRTAWVEDEEEWYFSVVDGIVKRARMMPGGLQIMRRKGNSQFFCGCNTSYSCMSAGVSCGINGSFSEKDTDKDQKSSGI